MKKHRKGNPYYEWEGKLDTQKKKEYKDLIQLVKEFRKKHKIKVFLVNRELKKQGKRKRTTEKREKLKKR
jgi:hypothetical protein